MLDEVFIILLVLSNMYEVITKKYPNRKSKIISDGNIRLKPEDVSRIRAFLQSVDRYDDDSTRIKDPSEYCRSFHNCFECVKSMWFPCGWCHETGCTENTEKKCPLSIKDAKRFNTTEKKNACPRLLHDGPLLVPAGVHKNVEVKIYVPDPILYETEIVCLVKLKQRITHLKGLIVGDQVYCFDIMLRVDRLEFGDTETGTLKVIWGGAQPYSNEIPLIVYTCETLAVDCDSCRAIPASYGCGWCDIAKICTIADKCGSELIKWTLNRLTCEPYGKRLFYI